MTCRNTDLCFKYYFKNRNINQLKFYKIGTSQFLKVLKLVKNQDCPDKIGMVGRYVRELNNEDDLIY